jgi:hypothetical protein
MDLSICKVNPLKIYFQKFYNEKNIFDASEKDGL